MEIREVIATNIRYRQGWARRYNEDCNALRDFDVPPWLEGLDVGFIGVREAPPGFRISVEGGIEVVKAIQRATHVVLKRAVSVDTGAVSFIGTVGKVELEVHGALPLAPTCRLVPYTVEVTKFRVECDDKEQA